MNYSEKTPDELILDLEGWSYIIHAITHTADDEGTPTETQLSWVGGMASDHIYKIAEELNKRFSINA